MKLIKVCGMFSKTPDTHDVDKSMRVCFRKILKHMKLIKVCGVFSNNPEAHEVDKSMLFSSSPSSSYPPSFSFSFSSICYCCSLSLLTSPSVLACPLCFSFSCLLLPPGYGGGLFRTRSPCTPPEGGHMVQCDIGPMPMSTLNIAFEVPNWSGQLPAGHALVSLVPDGAK